MDDCSDKRCEAVMACASGSQEYDDNNVVDFVHKKKGQRDTAWVRVHHARDLSAYYGQPAIDLTDWQLLVWAGLRNSGPVAE